MKTINAQFRMLKKLTLSNKTRQLILDGVAMLFIFVFLCTLHGQYSNQDRFFEQLFNSEITETHPGRWLKGILIVETAIILSLIYPKTRKLALMAGTVFLLTFVSYTTYIYWFTDGVTFKLGVLSNQHWYQQTWLHLSLIGLACLSLIISGLKKSHTQQTNKRLITKSVLTY